MSAAAFVSRFVSALEIALKVAAGLAGAAIGLLMLGLIMERWTKEDKNHDH